MSKMREIYEFKGLEVNDFGSYVLRFSSGGAWHEDYYIECDTLSDATQVIELSERFSMFIEDVEFDEDGLIIEDDDDDEFEVKTRYVLEEYDDSGNIDNHKDIHLSNIKKVCEDCGKLIDVVQIGSEVCGCRVSII